MTFFSSVKPASLEEVGVNIVVADRGWILERLANEIASRHEYVSVNDQAQTRAGLQYYLNYSAWQGRVSPLEIAYFAHIEDDPDSRQRFFEVANAVDHCVCHSEMYERELRNHGVRNVTTISPGIDLEKFKPVVKIGVVGRTYASGRKGETLVEQVLDLDGIEWHFTGAGWPRPSREIAPQDMPAFYNEMDYILIPSLYEGGPMSVVEALACGTPVIAPPVGWVGNFPHHAFRAGDAADLRRVLEDIVRKRAEHRTLLTARSWSNWADEHDKLFRKLLGARSQTPASTQGPDAVPANATGPVVLALHGSEKQSRGGPSVRVPATAAALRDMGVDAQAITFPDRLINSASLVHGFNVWDPQTALKLAQYARSHAKPFVFSPIYLDQREIGLWQNMIPEAVRQARDGAEFDALLTQAVEDFARDPVQRGIQAAAGYDAVSRSLVNQADHVIYLSAHEQSALARIGATPKASSIVHNPVNIGRFAGASGTAFEDFIGARDYILCVGRIERRKNQLMLLHALRDFHLPVVLLGASTDPAYALLIDQLRTGNVFMPGVLDSDDPLLASAYAGARLVVQPSWAEGAPLAALEAAAAGANMILSDRSAEREYLGDFARYCDPANPAALRDAILEAYENPRSDGERAALRDMVQENYSYERHARATLEVYRQTWAGFAPPQPAPAPTTAPAIVMDITALVYRAGASGMLAGERALAESLIAQTQGAIQFVAWNRASRRFVVLDHSSLFQGDLATYVDFAGKSGLYPTGYAADTRCLVAGGMWMENSRYCDDLVAFADTFGIALSVLIYDISPLGQGRGPALAPMADLRRNLDLMLAAASTVMAVSDATAADLAYFMGGRGITVPPMTVVRPGDGLIRVVPGEEIFAPDIAAALSAGFVLAVAPAGVTDDERLLFRIWKALAERMGADCPLLVVATPLRSDKPVNGIVARARGERILTLDGLPDAALAGLFGKARLVVVSPGTPGGWNPVITESLARGLICIAPQSEAAAEAGGGAADLLDPLDLKLWQARLEYFLRSPKAREQREEQIRSGFTPTSWPAAGNALRAALANSRGRAEPGNYTIGMPVRLTDRPGNVRKRGGWHRSDSGGSWTSARQSRLSFKLPAPHDGDLTLMMEMRSPLAPRQDNICEVSVNGRAAGRLVLRGAGWSMFTLPIPAEFIAGRSEIEIELRGSRLLDLPVRAGSKVAARRGGIAVASLALIDPRYPFSAANYASNPTSLNSMVMIGETVDLTRDPRALAMLSDDAVFGTDWGGRRVNARPQLSLKILDRRLQDLVVRLRYRAVATPQAPLSATVATREGVVLGVLEADNDDIREVKLRLPRSLSVQPIQLEFLGAEKRRPRKYGVGLLDEAFGIGFFGLRVDPADQDPSPAQPVAQPYVLGKTLTFRQFETRDAMPAARFLDLDSWHQPEPQGTWTQGAFGRMTLHLAAAPQMPLHVRLDATAWVPPGQSLAVQVRVNSADVHSQIRNQPGPFVLQFEIAPWLAANQTLAIEIGCDRYFVPSLNGLGMDDRRLGLQLHSMTIADNPWQLAGEDVPAAPEMFMDEAWDSGASDNPAPQDSPAPDMASELDEEPAGAETPDRPLPPGDGTAPSTQLPAENAQAEASAAQVPSAAADDTDDETQDAIAARENGTRDMQSETGPSDGEDDEPDDDEDEPDEAGTEETTEDADGEVAEISTDDEDDDDDDAVESSADLQEAAGEESETVSERETPASENDEDDEDELSPDSETETSDTPEPKPSQDDTDA